MLFIIFINDLDDGVVNKFIKFVDDTKIVSKVASEDQIKILQSDLVGVIFRPYGWKSSVTIWYFPSMRTEIYTHVYAIFHGSLQLNFAIFRLYRRKITNYYS